MEAIGPRPVGSSRGVSAVVRPAGVSGAIPVATGDENATSLTNVTATAAASAPIDFDRVAVIKHAIATGTFPILPATIADRLLALKLQWNSNDPA